NTAFGELGPVVSLVGLLQAGHVILRVLQLYLALLLLDVTQDGAFANFYLCFSQVGLGGLKVGGSFLGVAVVLGQLLVDLMAEVVILGLSVSKADQLGDSVEDGK